MASVYIASTCQKTDRPHPCHPWTKKSPKLVSNLRKDTEKQPYIWAANGPVAMSRCAGASRAKIETSRSLRFECVKRIYEMTVTVETIRKNIRISSLPVSSQFGGVARGHTRVSREKRNDCRSLTLSFAASFTSNNWRTCSQANGCRQALLTSAEFAIACCTSLADAISKETLGFRMAFTGLFTFLHRGCVKTNDSPSYCYRYVWFFKLK